MKKTEKVESRIIAKECILSRIRRINRVVTSIYEKKLSKYNIKATQLNLLVTLSNVGSIQPKRLAAYYFLEKSSLSRTLVPLEANGWILTKKSGINKRIYITQSGRKIVQKLYPEWKEAQLETRKILGENIISPLKEVDLFLNKSLNSLEV